MPFFTVCSRACVDAIIDAALTCFDNYDSDACSWDILFEYVLCGTCACEIIEDIASAIVGQDLDLC